MASFGSIFGRAGVIAVGLLGLGIVVTSCSASGDSQTGKKRPGGGNGGEDGEGGSGGDGGSIGEDCLAGEQVCDGTVRKVCDGEGGFTQELDCAADGKVCDRELGCVACVPDTTTCEGGVARMCNENGTGFVEFACDELQGMQCNPTGCQGACTPKALGDSYIGCDYYPTVTFNSVWSGFHFAVAVGNTGDKPASVTVTRGSSLITNKTVAPGSLEIINLPWVSDLKGPDGNAFGQPSHPGASRISKSGAYRLRSTQPVTVYQFNPLEYEIKPKPNGCLPSGSDCKSYSNDASLLMPTNTMTGDYTVLAWPSSGATASFYTVTATQDGTSVTVKGQGQVAAGAGVDASGNGTVTLNAGDVLAILGSGSGDVSGSRVQASKPVQVIAGQSCANVPDGSTGYCDHIEEALFPVETLGKDYLVTFPAAPGADSPHTIRVAAILPNTKVTFDPPIRGAATLNPGQAPLEIKGVTQDVRISSDQAIIVAQYMHGSAGVPSQKGDPSQSLAIATEQFRKSYLFLASKTYDVNFVNVVAKTGSKVTIDGTEIPEAKFSAIGSSGYSVARYQLSQSEVHNATSSEPFGIVTYGYGSDTSYMYPGGLDLQKITPPPPK